MWLFEDWDVNGDGIWDAEAVGTYENKETVFDMT